ncbi:MAG: polysaccharide biosynthesis C-terminal domain-containing protein [Faecalibacterium sp.]|nr:polysaccharide biosynthesis C-terminal domain-containing protein [Faecalibacterium sp.]
MAQDKYSKLASNAMLFTISNFSSKLLSLMVHPFLTYAMSEMADLGISKLLSQCANLIIPFVSLGMSNAIIRFGLDKGNDKKQVFTNGLLTILLGYGMLLLCWPVVSRVSTVADYAVFLYVYVLTSCMRTLCTQFVRSRQLNKLVAIDGILCTFLTLVGYVVFLLGFDMGAEGYLLAIICGDVLSALFLFTKAQLWQYLDFGHLNGKLWKEMLRFSLPMIPAQISFWIINASDLFFVKYMCEGQGGRTGDEWSALLSTGYFLPTILNTLGLIFYEAWQLSAVTEEAEREKFFSNIFRAYSSVLFCCAAGIIWLARPALHIMKANYYAAWQFVPFLTLAATFTCFNQFFNSIYVVYRRSTSSMFTMMAGAAANCVMNYLFILWWGPVGATYASFLGLLLVFVLRAADTRSLLVVDFKPRRVALNLALLVAEAFVLLAEVPLWFLWTGLFTAGIIVLNLAGVWQMARLLLPKLLGRRGRALVGWVERHFARLLQL